MVPVVVMWFRGIVTGRASRRIRSQAGFTLVELLVGMFIGGLVIATAAVVLSFVLGQNRRSSASISDSNSAFRTGNTFADDVQSASPVPGFSDPVTVGADGCGASASLVRLAGIEPDGNVLVRSYHRVVDGDRVKLVRRQCSGATLAAALAAPAASNVVVVDLDPGGSAVSVTCDGGPVSSTCRLVQMEVMTAGGEQFSVRGTIGSVLSPTPTTTPTPVLAPETGTCTILASATTWGATGGYAGSSSATHGGDPMMATYNDGNKRRSFLLFDLTQPCAEATPDWPTLPGGRNITAVDLYLAYMGKSSDSCGLIPGISYDGQEMEPLNATSLWSEPTLNGSNMPSGVRSGFTYNFSSANAGALTLHTSNPLTEAVKHWYASNDWVNNGWRLSRSSPGDTCGTSNLFASRHHPTVGLQPKLVISWGP